MKVTFDWSAAPDERFAEDVKLPEPGSSVRFHGHESELVSARRVDNRTLRLVVEVPDALEDLIGRVFPSGEAGKR